MKLVTLTMTDDEEYALQEALAYYRLSDYGHGGAAPDGGEEHRTAIRAIVAALEEEE